MKLPYEKNIDVSYINEQVFLSGLIKRLPEVCLQNVPRYLAVTRQNESSTSIANVVVKRLATFPGKLSGLARTYKSLKNTVR